jgi:epoxyqueuosine reductase QueG
MDEVNRQASVRRCELRSEDVKRRAHELGFDLCGIAPAGAYPELRHLETWLDRGYAGEMRYMARSAERRGDVRRILPSARSVVCVAVLYNVTRPYSTERTSPGEAGVSRYAWGDEFKGNIPEPQRAAVWTHAYGCDICQEVCPWNLSSPSSSEAAWLPRAGLDAPALADLWRRSDAELAALLAGSAMSRAGERGLRRNLAVAIGNSGDRAAAATLDEPVDAPSIRDPMVAEHVAWARLRATTDT